MGIYLNPGNSSFEQALRSKIYVDKTGLLEFTNEVLGTEQKNICVGRPRRFGKSMAANMLVAYYSKGCDSKRLFKKLEISSSELFEEHLNKYNVFFWNMQRFLSRASRPEEMTEYLQKQVLIELKEQFPDLLSEETHLVSALEQLYSKTQEEFIFVIDEWDCIFREEKKNIEAQLRYLDFLRDLLKGQQYVKMAYMTGILPIKKYGTHSALNMFDEYSMTDPSMLARYVGFTGPEVLQLCKQYEIDFSELQSWYDGYRFEENLHIYNPKSVVDAIRRKRFGSYWTQTETYEALKIYIVMNFDGLKDAIVSMIGGGTCKIDTGSFQNDMTTFHGKDEVLTLLIHLGYLAYNIEHKEVYIPNEEVREEFIRAVKKTDWDIVVGAITDSEDLQILYFCQEKNMQINQR